VKKPKDSDSLELGGRVGAVARAFKVGISIGMGMLVGVDNLDVLVIVRKWRSGSWVAGPRP
jgi:hypothetical protein